MKNPLNLTFTEYIGDGVYVGHDGYHVWLYTYNGLTVTNKVALEPEVLKSFGLWLDSYNKRAPRILHRPCELTDDAPCELTSPDKSSKQS